MKRKLMAMALLCVAISCAAPAYAEESTEAITETAEDVSLTWEDLEEIFALEIDTEGLSADALYALGQQYENGEDVVQWYGMAMAYYEAAAEAGSSEAEAAIDALNAFKEEMMNEENSPEGQGWIFTFFRTGTSAGQAGDEDMAYTIYHDDVFFFEDPLVRGLDEMASLLCDGSDEASMEKTMAIYQYTAEVLGKGKSYSAIGMLYEAEEGSYVGITHSMDTAIEYYEKAYLLDGLSQQDGKAPRYLADIYAEGYIADDGTEIEADYEKAAEYYLTAVELGDTTASYSLGVYYQNGIGVEQDYEKSAEYYLQALEGSHSTQLGIPQTYLALGQYYENGIGVEQDTEKAIEYYTGARDAAQDNLDLVNVGAENEEMEAIRDEAVEALERLGAAE